MGLSHVSGRVLRVAFTCNLVLRCFRHYRAARIRQRVAAVLCVPCVLGQHENRGVSGIGSGAHSNYMRASAVFVLSWDLVCICLADLQRD